MKNWGRILGDTSLNREGNGWPEKEDEGLGSLKPSLCDVTLEIPLILKRIKI